MANIAQGFSILDAAGNPIGSPSNPIQAAQNGTWIFRTSVASAPPESLGTQVEQSATAAAAAAGSATLPGAAGLTTYIRGFVISSAAVAAAVAGLVTITGLTNTLNFEYVETVASGGLLIVSFGTGIPASAQNTAIVVNLPAIAGGGASAISAWGVQF